MFEQLFIKTIAQTIKRTMPVKNHLQSAAREVLMAALSSLSMVKEWGLPASMSAVSQVSELVLQKGEKTLESVIDIIAAAPSPQSSPIKGEEDHGKGEHHREEWIRQKVLQAIIKTIDEEIENISDLRKEKNKVKLEALLAVKKVLMKQRDL